MQELSTEQRFVIMAKLDTGPDGRAATHREIAEQLGVPERQVGRILHAAQLHILTRMTTLGYDFSDLKEEAR